MTDAVLASARRLAAELAAKEAEYRVAGQGGACELCGEPAGMSGHRTMLGPLEMLRCDPAALARARARRRALRQPEPAQSPPQRADRSSWWW